MFPSMITQWWLYLDVKGGRGRSITALIRRGRTPHEGSDKWPNAAGCIQGCTFGSCSRCTYFKLSFVKSFAWTLRSFNCSFGSKHCIHLQIQPASPNLSKTLHISRLPSFHQFSPLHSTFGLLQQSKPLDSDCYWPPVTPILEFQRKFDRSRS